MEVEFAGAAREVTGSCHLLRVGGRTIMLDWTFCPFCGTSTGHEQPRQESRPPGRRPSSGARRDAA